MPSANLGVWKISESLETLESSVFPDKEELETLEKIKNTGKKREWLSVRLLAKELSGDPTIKIIYAESGKPRLKNSKKKVSISHTKNYVAIIIDAFETGIDIQHLDQKIERIAHKFMSDSELKSIEHKDRIEQLSVYWCAKEALYKLYGNKNIVFKNDLLIDSFEYAGSGKINGTIIKDGKQQQHCLCYEKIESDTLLVYVLNDKTEKD